MAQKIISYLTTIILLILIPLVRQATIEMVSYRTPKFPIDAADY